MQVEVGELLARFLIGGVIVSFFAGLAEMFRPKSFAGLSAQLLRSRSPPSASPSPATAKPTQPSRRAP